MIRLRFGHNPEQLELNDDGTAGNDSGTRLRSGAGGLWMDRTRENFSTCLRPIEGVPTTDISGRYRCEELGTELTVTDTSGTLYGGFSGFLGQGRMELLEPIGSDVWALPCPRALDHTPPGDWTLPFRRDAAGRVHGVKVGCWLARQLKYERVE
jgi:D-aminopeptidase